MQPDDFILYTSLFQGREGSLRLRGGGVLQGEEMTLERLAEQAAGKESYGIYLRRLDGTVSLAMFDVDVPDGRVPPDELMSELDLLRPTVLGLLEAVRLSGLKRENVLLEFSGVGYHLWFFMERPLPASKAALFLRGLQTRAGLQSVLQKPKPGELSAGAQGEGVWLPLRLNDNSNLHSVFIDRLEDFNPANFAPAADFSILRGVQRVPLALVEQIAELGREGEDLH